MFRALARCHNIARASVANGARRLSPIASIASVTNTKPSTVMKASSAQKVSATSSVMTSNAFPRFMSVDADSDPQFKAQVKAQPITADSEEMQDMLRQIKEVVTNNNIVLFMKGTPDAPQCGFSGRVVKILSYLNISYESCNVLDNVLLREGIKVYSDWPTIPQLYVKGEFIGGADIVTSMFTSGELHELLGVPKPAAAATGTSSGEASQA